MTDTDEDGSEKRRLHDEMDKYSKNGAAGRSDLAGKADSGNAAESKQHARQQRAERRETK